MVTRIFWLGVLFCGFWLFGGCHDDLLEQEPVDKMNGLVYLSRSGSVVSENEEMYIKMYIMQGNVIKAVESFSSVKDLNDSELILETGDEYRLLITAEEPDGRGRYQVNLQRGDTVDFDHTVLFSVKDTCVALNKPFYYGVSVPFHSAEGVRERIELKPVVAKLNFEVDAKFLNFSGKLWGGKGVYLNGKPVEGRTLYHVNMAKKTSGTSTAYLQTFYVVGDETGEPNEIRYELEQESRNFMGQVFIEYLQGLSDHIDVVKSGCVYSYYVNKRLYSSNMDAILAVDVYEPLSGIKVKSGIVMMESAGVVKRVSMPVDMGESSVYLPYNFGDFPRGIWRVKEVVLMDSVGREMKKFTMDHEFKIDSKGVPGYNPGGDEWVYITVGKFSWNYSDLKTDGEGTMENPYIVNSPEKFNAIRYIATGEKRYFKQICDIDFSEICAVGGECYNDGEGWIGMGEAGSNVLGDYVSGFTGCYDGGKNRITGLSGRALFNYVINGGEVKEVIIDESCKITDMATLVNYSLGGVISGCVNYATIVGNAGLVGKSKNGKVLYCTNYGTIGSEGLESVGGIVSVGLGKDTIVGCVNEGSVFARKNAGGILSSTGYYTTGGGQGTPLQDHAYEGLIEDCENRGEVSAKENVGGISGLGGFIQNCRNKAGIVSTATVSHLDSTSCVGGIMGKCYQENCAVVECENTGTVSGVKYVGGIVGYFAKHADSYPEEIAGCRNSGYVVGVGLVGGVVGYVNRELIKGSTNTGSVQGRYGYGDIYGELVVED